MILLPLFSATAVLAPEIVSIIGITNSMITNIIGIGFMILFVSSCASKIEMIPDKKQNFFEAIVEMLYENIATILGSSMAKKSCSLLGTLFIFILISNWFSLLPGVGSIGFYENKNLIPLLRPITTDMNMTLALAFVSMFFWFLWSMQSVGIVNFIKDLFGVKGGMKGPILLLLVPLFLFVGVLELLSICVRPISLSLRLYGNVFAGEQLLGTMINIGHLFNAKPWLTAVLSCIIPIPFYFMELLVGFLQAMVFTLLILVYLQLSTTHADH